MQSGPPGLLFFHNPFGTMDNSFPGDLQVSGELLYLYFVKALIVNVITANPTNANTLSYFGVGYNRFIISNLYNTAADSERSSAAFRVP